MREYADGNRKSGKGVLEILYGLYKAIAGYLVDDKFYKAVVKANHL